MSFDLEDFADITAPVAERVYLIESLLRTTYGTGGGSSGGSGPGYESVAAFTIADFPTGAGGSGNSPFIELEPYEFKVASVDYVTGPFDLDHPSEWWDGRAINPGAVSRSTSLTPVGESAVQAGTGTIVISNADGFYDTILDQFYAVSQSLSIKIGQSDWPWRDFVEIWRVRITGISVSHAELTIEVADQVTYTDVQYQTHQYGGSAGLEGDVDLIGVQKPTVLGTIRNYQPVLINAAHLVYQIHDGAILAVAGVFDRGVVIVPTTPVVDYPDFGALTAATIASGKYATCLAQGLFRLGASPSGEVTCDATGDVRAGSTTRSIAVFLATLLQTELVMDVDLTGFASIPAYPAGWAWSDPFTYQAALSRFVGDTGSLWGTIRAGSLSARQLLPPSPYEGDLLAFDEVDVIELERISLPEGYEATHRRRVIRHSRNWHVQNDQSLASAAPDKGFKSTEWRLAIAESSTLTLNSLDPAPLETSLADAASGTALAIWLIQLHGVRRRLFTLKTKIFGSLPALASNLKLTYPRFGLQDGVIFRVVEINQAFEDSTVTYTIWG